MIVSFKVKILPVLSLFGQYMTYRRSVFIEETLREKIPLSLRYLNINSVFFSSFFLIIKINQS